MTLSPALQAARSEFIKSPEGVGYNSSVESLRDSEYPQLKDTTYLDHAGATLYATTLLQTFTDDLCSNLYGNPHSRSLSAQLTARRIDDLRYNILALFGAKATDWDVVFTANATAGIKLVADAFVGAKAEGWWYGYHGDSHTSLVGVRDCAGRRRCFDGDSEVQSWLEEGGEEELGLFAWPAQSNFTGRRMGGDWAGKVRRQKRGVYTLLDAASYAMTTALDLSNTEESPDFVVLSFYKIFGFPDLGALIVRRDSADILRSRRYFGGGTVDAVVGRHEPFFVSKRTDAPHAHLEDGTLPFHNLIALEKALDTHARLFGSYRATSSHTLALASWLYSQLSTLKHSSTGAPLIKFYSKHPSFKTQGPILAFTLQRPNLTPIPHSDVESLASVKSIHIRTGGLCNPGGIEEALGFSPEDVMRNFRMGHKCWGGKDVIDGKPTGAVRVSLGVMSAFEDCWRFVKFVKENYLDRTGEVGRWGLVAGGTGMPRVNAPGGLERRAEKMGEVKIESLAIYPIKSCGPFHISPNTRWPITENGLAFDRHFAIIHAGTARALTVKEYPSLAQLIPSVDLRRQTLTITLPNDRSITITIPLQPSASSKLRIARVCGRNFCADIIDDPHITSTLSTYLCSPAQLARIPHDSELNMSPGSPPPKSITNGTDVTTSNMSNTSPLLLLTRSSLQTLPPAAASPAPYRGNIILSSSSPEALHPFEEEHWSSFDVINPLDPGAGSVGIAIEGKCKRCRAVGSEVFGQVVREREGYFGVLCGVGRKGDVGVGDWVGRIRRK